MSKFRIVENHYSSGKIEFIAQISKIITGEPNIPFEGEADIFWENVTTFGCDNSTYGGALDDIKNYKCIHEEPNKEIIHELNDDLTAINQGCQCSDCKCDKKNIKEADEAVWIDFNNKSIRGQLVEVILRYMCYEYPSMFVDQLAEKLQATLDSLLNFKAFVTEVHYDENESLTSGYITYYNNETETKVSTFTIAPKEK